MTQLSGRLEYTLTPGRAPAGRGRQGAAMKAAPAPQKYNGRVIGTSENRFSAMASLPCPSNARVVGECIYCASTKEPLTKEHAVPYGLNGPWTLLAASCAGCSDIKHRFERDTLKGLYPAIRAVLAMQTRRPKERPRTLPLVLENQGVRRTKDVTLTEFPLYLP